MGASASSPSDGTEPSMFKTVMSYVMYLFMFSIVAIVILTIVHFTIHPIFSFSPADLGFIKIPVPSDKQVAFDKFPAGNDISANLVNVVPCGYTMSMDLYLTGSFDVSTSPRVILYNARDAVPGGISFTKEGLATKFPDANVIMWIDPEKNDLYMSTITSDLVSGSKRVETSEPIENIPIGKPFRITYVYTQHFIEVYVNGSLQITMPYKNAATISQSSSPFFFGHASSRTSCLVGNVFYWPHVLTSREVRASGAPVSTVAFFTKL